MSYNPVTDFIALLRLTADGAEFGRMPGLDCILAGLQRAGIISLWTGQTAPTVNQSSTVWLKAASPSWSAEGVVYLHDGTDFVPATPALWAALLTVPAGYVFDETTAAAAAVSGRATLFAVRRTVAAPAVTVLTLPALSTRTIGSPLRIVDWSVVLAEHTVHIVTPDGASIMRRTSYNMFSTPDQLAGVNLYPSSDLNGWVIAP